MEAENIFEHGPLLRREITLNRVIFQRIFNVIAD
jgi:hypothetical protein